MLSSTPLKNEKKLVNVQKIEGTYFQCVNNQYAKFEQKGMKTVGSYRLQKPDII